MGCVVAIVLASLVMATIGVEEALAWLVISVFAVWVWRGRR